MNKTMFDNVLQFSELTRTAAEAAAQIGCDVGQIAKSIVFKTGSGEALVVVASGRNRIDEQKLAKLSAETISKADAETVREKTGYVIGGVPPWGHKTKLRTFVDADLKQYDKIYAAAGKNNAVFPLTFDELVIKSEGVVADIRQ